MDSSHVVLDVVDLACERGGRRLFSNLNVRLQGGEFFELRGANGVGKSSLLRLLAGLNDPASGHFSMPRGFHYVGHQEAIKPALSVRENLAFWKDLQGKGDVEVALSAFGLMALADEQAALLSQGQKRRLALSRLALATRGLWLLDEPTVGLDAAAQVQLQALMAAHLEKGGGVLAATHVDLGVEPRQTVRLGDA